MIEDVLSNKAMWHIELGDCLGVLRGMPSESVHTVITSPPYFNLRDYGTGRWEGGDEGCDHRKNPVAYSDKALAKSTIGTHANTGHAQEPYLDVCGKCGARRIDQQIGLERTPQEFVGKLVEVFRELRRVLRSDGCAWVNMGDSYVGSGATNGALGATSVFRKPGRNFSRKKIELGGGGSASVSPGLKSKDLMGLPWRLAFALQEDGWYLRQDIIWHKPAPMPESVTDRCTKAHEYIFLLSKSERYYFDADAIRVPHETAWRRDKWEATEARVGLKTLQHSSTSSLGNLSNPNGANRRSVWSIPTEPLKDAHYAAYPTRLPELCLLAGTSARGCCPECGAQWRRVVDIEQVAKARNVNPSKYGGGQDGEVGGKWTASMAEQTRRVATTTGWQPTCTHTDLSPIPSLVLDPFAGSGSTLIAALRNGRRALGIDISEEYGRIARRRIMGVTIPHPEMVAV